jgi:hypothetical protein
MRTLLMLVVVALLGCDGMKLPSSDEERVTWTKKCNDICGKHNLKWSGLWTFVDERQFCECRAYFEVEDGLQAEGAK